MSTAATPERPDTSSALAPPEGGEPAPKKPSRRILSHEIEEGVAALERPAGALFLSALSAGLDIGFSLFLMAVMRTRAAGVLPEPVVLILVANMYAVGFIFVVLGRSELFTEQTTLAVLPVLGGRASVGALLRLWVIVYVANLIGAAGFVLLAAFIGPALGVINPSAFGEIAHRLLDHSGRDIFLGAVLAGWLMGLLSWLVAAGRDTISQVVLVWIITAAIGFAGVSHVVLGPSRSWPPPSRTRASGPPTSAASYCGRRWATRWGGSVFVALIKYGHARPESAPG